MRRYIIVGGVAAGATAAARLRRLDEEAKILLIERGSNVSYANCGFPYYIGGEIQSRNAIFVATKESIEAKYNIDVRQRTEVTGIDKEAHKVNLKNLETGEESIEEYTKLLLATGSSPIVPPFPGVDGDRVFTLWSVPDTDRIKEFVVKNKPKSVVVVGGGFIGLEMVENLVRLGVKVSLVEMMPQVMAPFDSDMSKMIENHLCEKGVDMHLGKGLVSIHDGGRRALLDDGQSIDCDMVLLSIGVRPNNELAKAINLKMGKKGHVIVDEHMKTSEPDIFAAGDLVESKNFITGEMRCVPLAGPANKQGRIAADNMALEANSDDPKVAIHGVRDISGAENRYIYKGTQGTSVAQIFDLDAASTGLNERQLKQQGMEYMTDYAFSLVHPQSHAGYFPGALPMCIKLIFSLKDGKVLGAQIVGYDGVDKRIDVISTAMRFEATVYDLIHLELAYAPPYSSAKDPVNMAGYAATNILEGLTDVRTWDQALEAVKNSDKNELIDVREEIELMAHKIDGVKNIPLTSLRDRMSELSKDKSYYLFCAIGLRGYLAERILKQNGYDVKDVLGGIRTYQAGSRCRGKDDRMSDVYGRNGNHKRGID